MSSLLSPILIGKDYQVRKDIVAVVRRIGFSQYDVASLSLSIQFSVARARVNSS